MYINADNLRNDMDWLIDETNLEEIINSICGDEIDDDTATEIAYSFFHSIIVKLLYKQQISYWGTKYNDALLAKLDLRKEESNEIKKKMENTSAIAIEEFMMSFNLSFGDAFTCESKKIFRHYKFRDINKVNDYTILYFTYKLHHIYCSEHNIQEDQEVAKKFAKMAYDMLKKYKTITCDNLTTFIRKFDLESPYYTYLTIFIEFVQDVYFSDIEDVLIYAIFSRFSQHIMLINTCLSFLDYQPKKHRKQIIEFKDKKKISKYVSNQKRSLLNCDDEDAKKIISLIKKLQSEFTKFPKNTSELKKLTNSQYHQACIRICYYLKQLDSYKDTKWAIWVSKIIDNYKYLSFKTDDKEIGIYDIVIGGFIDDTYKNFKKIYKNLRMIYKKLQITKTCFEENIFLRLLFSPVDFKQKEYITKLNEITDKATEYIEKNITINITQDISEEKRAYNEIIQYVDLNVLNPSILDCNLSEHPNYDDIILFLENIVF